MLDAGPAREYDRDVYISQFETITIRKLLSSPHYLGRSYLNKCKGTEKYIKNKQICDLIDKLRYKGQSDTILDGGFASTSQTHIDTLDLGNAYPPRKAYGEI
jgi:hypothetical protein